MKAKTVPGKFLAKILHNKLRLMKVDNSQPTQWVKGF